MNGDQIMSAVFANNEQVQTQSCNPYACPTPSRGGVQRVDQPCRARAPRHELCADCAPPRRRRCRLRRRCTPAERQCSGWLPRVGWEAMSVDQCRRHADKGAWWQSSSQRRRAIFAGTDAWRWSRTSPIARCRTGGKTTTRHKKGNVQQLPAPFSRL